MCLSYKMFLFLLVFTISCGIMPTSPDDGSFDDGTDGYLSLEDKSDLYSGFNITIGALFDATDYSYANAGFSSDDKYYTLYLFSLIKFVVNTEEFQDAILAQELLSHNNAVSVTTWARERCSPSVYKISSRSLSSK